MIKIEKITTKTLDFKSKTTYFELQTLYASGKISLEDFVQYINYFWKTNNFSIEEIRSDYKKFKFCFNLFFKGFETEEEIKLKEEIIGG